MPSINPNYVQKDSGLPERVSKNPNRKESSDSSWAYKVTFLASCVLGATGIYYLRSQALQKLDEGHLSQVNKFLTGNHCEPALQRAHAIYFDSNKDIALNSVFTKCPEQKIAAAKLMRSTEQKDQAFRELFHEALGKKDCNTAFARIKNIYYADHDLDLLSGKCPELREKAIDQMSFLKRNDQYRDLFYDYLNHNQAEKAYHVAEKVYFNNDLFKELAFRSNDLSIAEKAAKQLPDEERAGVYHRIVQAHINQGNCPKALKVAKTFNYSYLGEELGAIIRPEHLERYYRGASNQRLRQAIDARRERLALVRYQCDAETSQKALKESGFGADDFAYYARRIAEAI